MLKERDREIEKRKREREKLCENNEKKLALETKKYRSRDRNIE